MYKQVSFKLQGSIALMHHNPQLSDPMNPIAKDLKTFTGKRKKTEQDYEMMAKLEWIGGLYLDAPIDYEIKGGNINIEGGGKPCVPGEHIEGTLIKAGMHLKRKKDDVRAGIVVDENPLLIYPGPTSPAEMWKKGGFADTRRVCVQGKAVMRTRVIYRNWQLAVTVGYLPDLFNHDEIVDMMRIAGQIKGIGAYRPKFGRFVIAEAS